MSTTIIIPNYNGAHFMAPCLEALDKQTVAPDEIIVVDNGSTDGSLELLKSRYPSVRIIANNENLGFAAAVNIGIKASTSEFVLLLNNDTEAEPGMIEYLERAMRRHPDAFSVASKMIQLYHPEFLDSTGDLYTVTGWGVNRGNDRPSNLYNHTAYVFSACAGAALYRRQVFEQIGYFDLPKEENPAMGNRALRICLNRPEIFHTQLRALFRASAFGKLGIMFPMVTSVWEVKEARKMCEQVKKELTEEGKPFADDVQIGIMIETPAAAVMSDRLAKLVDFFSCGTNDLTQYTLACDRQNADLGRFYDPHHPAVLRALKMVCDNAHKNGVWVGICGELGADLALTETFLSIGIDELSVSPRSVLPLRQKIREINVAAVKDKVLADLLSDETPL